MARSKQRYRRRSAAEWEAIIARQEDSGLSQEAFCQREGLARTTFERWRRKLRGPAEKAVEFIDLTPALPPAARGWELEVRLPGGISLQFRG